MSYALGFLLATVAGWWVAAADALFRAEDRPSIFQGNLGMLLLLVITGGGGLLFAFSVIWILRISPSASIACIIGLGGWLGAWLSNLLNVSASGATNRMMVGLVGMGALYGIAWTFFQAP
jgi:hypothetical protein